MGCWPLKPASTHSLDGQHGIFSYTPVYWLSACGSIYLIFFCHWNGIFLLATTGALYSGYHLANYGILGKVSGPYDSIPFLPFLGIFIAIAHHRFGKFVLFRAFVRVLLAFTFVITGMLLLFFTEFPAIGSRFSEIQRHLMVLSGKYVSEIFPSMQFQLVPPALWIWLGVSCGIALICCYQRTRLFSANSSALPLAERKDRSALPLIISARDAFSHSFDWQWLCAGSSPNAYRLPFSPNAPVLRRFPAAEILTSPGCPVRQAVQRDASDVKFTKQRHGSTRFSLTVCDRVRSRATL